MRILPISRRTLLRGAGISLALPFLEAMRPTRASAQSAGPKHYFGLFYPNGTERNLWVPADGPLSAGTLSPALQDFAGFAAEGIWPAGGPVFDDVTVIGGVNHSGVSPEIHQPALALAAHKGVADPGVPGAATLDQVIADSIGTDTPFRHLALAATGSTDLYQGYISFREGGQATSTYRDPLQMFEEVFANVGGDDQQANAAALAAARRTSILDFVKDDAARLQMRLGAEDKRRVDQYLTAVSELETQLTATPAPSCIRPDEPSSQGNWHVKAKVFMDLGVLAMACGLTRVVTLQYSDSWGVHYGDYTLGEGIEGLGTWSDHFISHKLGDTDRATDLDALDMAEATRVANLRVLTTGRFKARRFAYLVEQLKAYPTEGGTLLDDSLAMFCAENGDGDSHSRTNMPILLAGHAGGFETGRALTVSGNTGSLHASILKYYGVDASDYGDPMGNVISEI